MSGRPSGRFASGGWIGNSLPRGRRFTRLVLGSPAVYSIANCIHSVKRTAYMDFREAIDRLGERITHEQTARELGVSVASVRQYRLPPEANAHRSAPAGWAKVLASLARNRGRELSELADELERLP